MWSPGLLVFQDCEQRRRMGPPLFRPRPLPRLAYLCKLKHPLYCRTELTLQHGRHHAATGHLTRDEVFVPKTRKMRGIEEPKEEGEVQGLK